MHSRDSGVRLWQVRATEKQSIEETGSFAPVVSRGAGYLAQRNSLFGGRRLGFSEHAVEGPKATKGEHAGGRSPSTGGTKSRHQGARWLPYSAANFGECVSRERKRYPIGSRTVATF